jgi:hypothetical protein
MIHITNYEFYIYLIFYNDLRIHIYRARNLQYRQSKLFKQDVDILSHSLEKVSKS